MSESAHLFGPDSGLLGILAEAGGDDDLCCLLINSGIVPRIGPHRMNVKIARALAASGIDSLRFDLSGLGDSKPPSGAATNYLDQAVRDIRSAMDFVERHSGRERRFALFGICSGAVNGYHAAQADERLVGLLMLDGFWYRTRWTEPVRLWKRFRAMSMRRIAAALRRKLRRTVTAPAPAESRPDIFATDGSGNPRPAEFAAAMNQITRRGGQVFLLYTDSVSGLVSYDAQIPQAFKGEYFAPRIRCEARSDIDHTAVSQVYQQRMTRIVHDWVVSLGVRAVPRS